MNNQTTSFIELRKNFGGLRVFSKKKLEKWVASDRLTEREQKQVEKIINRLPSYFRQLS